MTKVLFINNVPFEANADILVDSLEPHIIGKVIRCELGENKHPGNSRYHNGGYAYVTLENDDAADDLLGKNDFYQIYCMNRKLTIEESKSKKKTTIELGNWAGQLPLSDHGKRGKYRIQTKRWTFLCDWIYPSYYSTPTLYISNESEALLLDGFTSSHIESSEKRRIQIPFRCLESYRGILLDERDRGNGYISLYISLKCSPLLFRKAQSRNTLLLYYQEEEWIRTIDWTGCVNAFGRFLVYRLIFTENLEVIRKYFKSLSIPGIKYIPQCLVSCEEISKDSRLYFNGLLELLPFRICFKLESLISHGIITYHEIMENNIGERLSELICEDKETIAWYALNQMTIQRWDPADDRYNRRPVEIFEIAVRNFRGEFNEWHPANPNMKLKDTNRCAWVNHATITPIKIYFDGPEYEPSNRILRQYSEYADRFIRVTFKDENFNSLFINNDDDDISNLRIGEKLKNGFTVAGRQYEFLAFSSSQLRESSCWFVSADHELNANMIRENMGDFRAPALCAARMGQCFTSTIGTLELDEDNIKNIPDIKRNGFTFSDGCGKISPALAKIAAEHYFGTQIVELDNEIPSVFQIRFGGCKGVVSFDPNLQGKILCLRPSQTKFNAPVSTNLEIVRAVRNPLPGHLNRQLITVLSSLGVKDDVFITLQNKAITDIDFMMLDPQRAHEIVKRSSGVKECTHVTKTIHSMIEAGLMDNEPYLRGILECKRIFSLKSLRYKARIPVPKAYMLYGVLDETGILEPQQIYVQTSKIKSNNRTFRTANSKVRREHKVLTGPTVIARNPSLHPGDIKIVFAVDVPELSHLKNCVVFSQKGEQPLPNYGDEYFVCFNESMFPETDSEPMKYSSPERKTLDRDGPIEISDIHKFFIDFMKNDRIGQIGNLHLALADYYEEGVYHPSCIGLAELHSMAVDFNKTGVPVTDKLPKLDEYPDFMESKTKKEYKSQKILGKLYRNIKLNQPENDPLLNYEGTDIIVNREFLAQGYEDYLEEAEVCRNSYNSEIFNLMKKFRVKTEPEIISSNLLGYRRVDGRKSQDVRESISGTISFTMHKYRKSFLMGIQDNINQNIDNDTYNVHIPINNETKAKASAWYYVTYNAYNDDEFPDTPDDRKLLSFAWIISDIFDCVEKEPTNSLKN
ncbi:7511_t:CDS:10 [Scutellospora calospora]|uniref:7511_t:CDS:1 n=1 Tax=Scutellospora calospora TaxID=85575 RepID=A0ACA9KEY2_9GLOM|nr:7511_t:CDS:10 [Scutellospora calospora]